MKYMHKQADKDEVKNSGEDYNIEKPPTTVYEEVSAKWDTIEKAELTPIATSANKKIDKKPNIECKFK